MAEAEAATPTTPDDLGPDGPAARRVATAAVPVVQPVPDGPDAHPSTDDDLVVEADEVDPATARRFWGDDEDEAPPRSRRRARRRARRVVRVVRHVSPWSVLKVSIPFFICLWIVVVVAGVVLWRLGEQGGLVTNAENFWAEATGQESVEWDGEVLFRSAAIAGGVMAVASTGFAVLFAMLFNLICDITGGLRFTVLEVEPPRPRTRRGWGRRGRGDAPTAADGPPSAARRPPRARPPRPS